MAPLGEVQLGERPAVQLSDLHELCLAAYVRGLQAERCDVSLEAVPRVQALLMSCSRGKSALPMDLAYGMPGPGGADVVRERAATTFLLDLVDATGGA